MSYPSGRESMSSDTMYRRHRSKQIVVKIRSIFDNLFAKKIKYTLLLI